ncbi:hypothetical protein AMECASPLE_021964 [Ameca splendens]|uniref:Laminin G domain-containing protein n=1 Tax=Ameca splendens TaxID=208324 RepID=A0ABV0ZEG8_9TELE
MTFTAHWRGTSSSSEPRQLTSLSSLLDDQHWHHVVLRQKNSQLNLTVDKHTETVWTPEEFNLWDVKLLTVGAAQTTAGPRKNFQGCLENLMYNSVNLTELAKSNDQQVHIRGNVTFSCAEPVSVAVTFPGPHSFLQLPWTAPSSSGGMSIGFQFRTWNKAGLLLTFDLPRQGGEVWLYLNDARLYLQIQKGGRVLLELSAGSALNDGQWHVVDLTSRRGHLTVSVDKQGGVAHASPSFPVAVSNHIFFGGKSETLLAPTKPGLICCMFLTTVKNRIE